MFNRKINFVFCALCLIQLSLLSVSKGVDDTTVETSDPSTLPTGPEVSDINDYSDAYGKECKNSGHSVPFLQYSCGYVIQILQKVCNATFPNGKESQLKAYMDKAFADSGCENLIELVQMAEEILATQMKSDEMKENCPFFCKDVKLPVCQLFHGFLLLLQDSNRADSARSSAAPFNTTAAPTTTTAAPSKRITTPNNTTAAPTTSTKSHTNRTVAPTSSSTTAAPNTTTAAPSKRTTTLNNTRVAPTTSTKSHTNRTVAPTSSKTTPAPNTTTAAPSKRTTTPNNTTAAPTTSTKSHTNGTVAPTSSKTTAASNTTTAAPSKRTTTLNNTTAAPTTSTKSPTNRTVAPTSSKTTAAPANTTSKITAHSPSTEEHTGKTTAPNQETPDPSRTTGNKYRAGRNDVPASSHFLAYFLTACVICIAGYVLFHNKQKIVAFIVEGRSRANGRRSRAGDYKLLQSNVEEAMSGLDKSVTTKNYIY